MSKVSLPVEFSIVSKTKGILTKKFTIEKDGQIAKDSSQCFLQHGVVKRINCDFSRLPEVLDSLMENQALIHGSLVPVIEKVTYPPSPKVLRASATVVSKAQLEKNPGAVTRTKENFVYPKTGIIVIDYDAPEEGDPLTKQELINEVRTLSKALRTVAMVWRPSASSCISTEAPYKEHFGVKNQRIYMPYCCSDNEEVKSIGHKLEKLAWDKGLGYIMVSEAGTPLIRSIVDIAMFSPERLDFAAGAVCGMGLIQRMPRTEYYPGNFLDPSTLEEVDDNRFKTMVDQAKTGITDKIRAAKSRYRKKQVEKMVNNHKVPVRKAKLLVDARMTLKLLPDDVLYTDDMEPIKIETIINDPAKYHNMVVRDPMEPGYGSSKAKVFTDGDGVLLVNSFAHGGRVFRIMYDRDLYLDKLDKIEDKQELIDCWLDDFSMLHGGAADKELIIEKVKTITGLGKGTLKSDMALKEKTLAESDEIDGEDESYTHHQIAGMLKTAFPAHTIATEGAIYSYNGESCWKPTSVTDIEVMVAEKYDGSKLCSRSGDYGAIAKHFYKTVLDENFFTNIPLGIATPSNYWVVDKSKGISREEHTPEHRIRFMLPFDLDNGGPPEKLLEFLDWAFSVEPNQINLFQEVLGAIIFGKLNFQYQKAILFRGGGMNGKSTLLDVIRGLIPYEYITNVSPFNFNDPSHAHRLSGKLVNLVPDLEKDQILPSGAFKNVVDSSMITGRRLYQNAFEFPSLAAHVFSSNWDIKTTDDSYGMMRRWLILSFDNRISESDKIPELGAKLVKDEGGRILKWAVDGMLRLVQNNEFTKTSENTKHHEKIFNNINNVNVFLKDTDVIETGPFEGKPRTVLRSGLFTTYREWAEESGYKKFDILKKVEFNRYIQDELGYELRNSSKGVVYEGLKLVVN